MQGENFNYDNYFACVPIQCAFEFLLLLAGAPKGYSRPMQAQRENPTKLFGLFVVVDKPEWQFRPQCMKDRSMKV
jgi:hypothetical protein